MGLVIGMDEAGYGPNLGPLVLTATAWECDELPAECDFWSHLEEAVAQSPAQGDLRLHIADSKQVYSPARGLERLELGVLTALQLLDAPASNFHQLCGWLTTNSDDLNVDGEPWLADANLPLPFAGPHDRLTELAKQLTRCTASSGLRLVAVRSDIVLTERFNRLTAAADNKARVLSQLSLRLLRSLWNPDDPQPVLIVGDKHGGRNRYDDLIDEVLDGQMIFRIEEGKSISRYRVGSTELRFQMQAESHFPVALASMVSKYVRELAMELFNRWWCARVTNLKPTKGYPVDALRFRAEIADCQRGLDIPDAVLWRAR